jgi:hypothetical protein
MNTSARRISSAQANAGGGRGVCPICTSLRRRQTQMVQEVGLSGANHLCNFHAWALARAGPAAMAARILLDTLHTRAHEAKPSTRCDFCDSLSSEEAGKIKELSEKMATSEFLDWMRKHGTLCLRHSGQISKLLSSEGRKAVAELLMRTLDELEEDLADYAKRAQSGAHDGGGALGRAAEFLVCQRGIPGEEPTC